MDGRRWYSEQPNVTGRGIVAGYSLGFWAIVAGLGAVTGAGAAGLMAPTLLAVTEATVIARRLGAPSIYSARLRPDPDLAAHRTPAGETLARLDAPGPLGTAEPARRAPALSAAPARRAGRAARRTAAPGRGPGG